MNLTCIVSTSTSVKSNSITSTTRKLIMSNDPTLQLVALLKGCGLLSKTKDLMKLEIHNIHDLMLFNNELGKAAILVTSINPEQCRLLFSSIGNYQNEDIILNDDHRMSPSFNQNQEDNVDAEIDIHINNNTDSIANEQAQNIPPISSISNHLSLNSVIINSNDNSNAPNLNSDSNQIDNQIDNMTNPNQSISYSSVHQQSSSVIRHRHNPMNTYIDSGNLDNNDNASGIRFDEEKQIEFKNENDDNADEDANPISSQNSDIIQFDYEKVKYLEKLSKAFYVEVYNSHHIVYNFLEKPSFWRQRKVNPNSYIVSKLSNDEEIPVALVFFEPNENKSKVFGKYVTNEETGEEDFIPNFNQEDEDTFRNQTHLHWIGNPDE